jgi:DNA-binding NtrC family response regulator
MAAVLAELGRVAPTRLPVLLLGPSGCGKEVAARELHRQSGRNGPLVPVNCSAFAESLLESELFGHVRGAFTGALRERRGTIAAAGSGTLFLDEVAELSPRLQALLLRVLEQREVRPLGGDQWRPVEVRFIAATHRSLEELVARGSFRQDLLFRLQGVVLTLPALAERRHEFPFLLPRLLARICEEIGRIQPGLGPELIPRLAALPWPGNFRQLLHSLERALLRCHAGPLEPRHFPELAGGAQPPAATWVEATHLFQRDLLLRTLRAHGFRVKDAARELGLARPALYGAARRLGIDLDAERRLWLPGT